MSWVPISTPYLTLCWLSYTLCVYCVLCISMYHQASLLQLMGILACSEILQRALIDLPARSITIQLIHIKKSSFCYLLLQLALAKVCGPKSHSSVVSSFKIHFLWYVCTVSLGGL